jgi:N-terminal half of MaoC dehydratase
VPETWISEEMRSAIGSEFGTTRQSVPISLSDIRRWALAIYYPEAPPRLFFDEDYAASTSHGGIVAPEEFNPFAWFTAEGPVLPPNFEGPVRGSGPEEALGIKAPETNFVLNGGLEMEHGARMRPGDVITSGRTKLIEYRERQTRLGLMLITITETTWTNQRGEMVRITQSTGLRY